MVRALCLSPSTTEATTKAHAVTYPWEGRPWLDADAPLVDDYLPILVPAVERQQLARAELLGSRAREVERQQLAVRLHVRAVRQAEHHRVQAVTVPLQEAAHGACGDRGGGKGEGMAEGWGYDK